MNGHHGAPWVTRESALPHLRFGETSDADSVPSGEAQPVPQGDAHASLANSPQSCSTRRRRRRRRRCRMLIAAGPIDVLIDR
jgi:hypothetical protein